MTNHNRLSLQRAALMVGAALAFTGAASAQLLNGGFESGIVYSGAPDNLTPGTPGPWMPTPSGYTPDLYDNTGATGFDINGIAIYDNMFSGMFAHGGNRFIGFAASNAFGFPIREAFKQTTSPLVAGRSYTLSAFIAADTRAKAAQYGGPYIGLGEVEVLLDGITIGTFTKNTTGLIWELRSFSFIAPTTSTATFEFLATVDPNGALPSYIGLDDIELVPTPGSAMLMAVAGTIIATRCRRRVAL